MLEAPHQKPGGTFPSEWTWSTLESVCDAIFDCPHSTPKLKAGTNYLMARTQDVMTGVFRTDQAATVSADTYAERIKRAKPSTGDLLYSREGTYFGFAAEVPEATQVCLGQRMVLLRPNHKYIHHTFLRYWLNGPSMQRHIHGFRDGSVAERLNVSTIRQLPTALPPLPEQRRIAEILGALDDKIELNRKMNQTLEEMAQAIFKSWFIDFDGHTEFVNSELGKIPKGWRIGTVGDLFTLQRGFDITRKQQKPGIVPVVSSGGIKSYHSEALVDRPGVVIGRKGTLGTVFLLEEPHWPHDTTLWVKDLKNYPVLFVHQFLKNLDIGHLNVGSANPTLNRNHVHAMRTGVPPVGAADEYQATVAPLRARIRSTQSESAILSQLRDTLLPKLISGELRVPDVEKAVESVA